MSVTESESPCTDIAANALARAYRLAMPIDRGSFTFTIDESSPLAAYVRDHRALFKRDGAAVRCATALGRHVVSLGVKTLRNRQDVYDGVMNGWGGQSPDIAASVALELINQGADMYALGNELIWLAQVLPDVTKSRYDSFNQADSETRQTLKQYIPLFDTAIGVSRDRELYRQILSQTREQFGPNTENALIILASALPRG
jgi:hypothetical protein